MINNSKYTSHRLYFVTFSTALLLYLLHVIPIFSDTPYLWGTDHWRYMSRWLQIIVCVLAVTTLIPTVREKIYQQFNSLTAKARKILLQFPRPIKVILFIIISFSRLGILRQRTFFRGGGNRRLRDLARGERYVTQEPLDTYIHSILYEGMQKVRDIEPVFVFHVVSIVCGILFLSLVFRFSKIFADSRPLKLLTVGTFLLMGTVQLFFGYVENYSILTVLVMGYLYGGYKVLHYKFPLYVLSLIASFAICTHPSGVVLLPSLLYLFILELRKRKNNILRARMIIDNSIAAAIPFGILLSIFQLGVGKGIFDFIQSYQESGNLLPLHTTAEISAPPYGLLSIGHFIEMFNLYILIIPFGLFGIAYAFFDSGVRRSFLKKDSLFFGITALSYMLLSFLFNLSIGASRDWDLFSPAALPLTFFFLLSIRAVPGNLLHKIGIIFLPALFLHTAPWIGINAHPESSIQRFIALIDSPYWNNHSKGYGYDELCWYYVVNDKSNLALHYIEKAYKLTESERYLKNIAACHFNIGIGYLNEEDNDRAVSELLKALEINPQMIEPNGFLGLAYIKKNEYKKAIPYLQKATNLEPKFSSHWLNLGLCYINLNELDKAEETIKKGITNFPQTLDLYVNLGAVYIKENKFNSAVDIFQKALDAEMESLLLYINLGAALSKLGEEQKAIELYKSVLPKYPTSPDLLFNLAVILYGKNEISEAKKYLTQAVSLDPQHQKALSLLEKIQ